MVRFVVDLGDVKLSEEEHGAIATAIQAAVLSRMAKIPAAGRASRTLTRAGMGFTPPPEGPAKPPKPAAQETPAKPAKPAKPSKP